jgi:hypothetical protein
MSARLAGADACPFPLALPQQLGEDFDERVLPSIANEVLKAVVVRYTSLLMRALCVVFFLAHTSERCASSRWLLTRPLPRLAFRAPQAQFNADQLLTQREQVSSQVRAHNSATSPQHK